MKFYYYLIIIFICASCYKDLPDESKRQEEDDKRKKEESYIEKLQAYGKPDSNPHGGTNTQPQQGGKNLDNFFDYKVPEGWTKLASAPMKDINLSFGKTGECYLMLTMGNGGGIAANVNRWRKQFGMGDASTEDFKKLKDNSFQFLGRLPAFIVELQGPFRGKKDWAMKGIIATDGRATMFIKMLGSKQEVAENASRFKEFYTSFKVKGQTENKIDSKNSGYNWKIPEGWEIKEKPGRVLTITKDGCELYLYELKGDGGGHDANAARWAKQMGATLDSVSKPEVVKVLGIRSPLLDFKGDYKGMSGRVITAKARMLGFIVIGDQSTLTIKFTGPEEKVTALKKEFMDFCTSLERKSP